MRWRIYLPALAAIAMAAIGSMFTALGLGDWYPGIAKPEWTPGGSIISAAWTTIFLLFAVAGAIFFSSKPAASLARTASGLIVLNAVLNVAWSWLFFARHEVYLAFWEAVALDLSVLALIMVYRPVSRLAAWLLVPYAAWVAFASYLTYAIHTLNR